MSADAPVFEITEGKDSQFYWHLQAVNGEIVAQSEGYETEQGAEDGVDALKRNVLAALGIDPRVRLITTEIQTIEEAGGKLSVVEPETRNFLLIHSEPGQPELPA